jgi:hypothetical protein
LNGSSPLTRSIEANKDAEAFAAGESRPLGGIIANPPSRETNK